ncbi:MAG: hypothetical protein KKA54_17355 [Proteobacteria bacterium]|nr:hypothetical protein [Pseudomonadota bacterium]
MKEATSWPSRRDELSDQHMQERKADAHRKENKGQPQPDGAGDGFPALLPEVVPSGQTDKGDIGIKFAAASAG